MNSQRVFCSPAAAFSFAGIYPVTIRRNALRHLYMEPVKGCHLFKGCQKRFLDSVLTAARVEFFLPGVEVGAALST